jgi:thiol-disulfide isomerase/thioredoxin
MKMRVALLVLISVFAGGARLSAQDIGLELGTSAPAAKVVALDGAAVDLSTYIGTKPVLLEFWATWCSNCHELEPTMRAVHAKYGTQVNIVGVAVSLRQSAERVKAYVEKYKLPWIQLFDSEGNASGAYDAPATSYVVVLDRAGKVVYTGLGGKQDLEGAIRKVLAE